MKSTFALLLGCILLLPADAFAQRKLKQMDPEKQEREEQEKSEAAAPWTEKLTYGGNFGLAFGSQSSFLLLAPLVGYRVTDDFMVGTGASYMYWSQSYPLVGGQSLKISDNIFGLNFFARHNIAGPVFAHIEYQPTNFTAYNQMGDHKRIWTNSLYIGGGVNQRFSERGGVYVMVLYDLLWQAYPSDPTSYQKSFMVSPWDLRAGFFF